MEAQEKKQVEPESGGAENSAVEAGQVHEKCLPIRFGGKRLLALVALSAVLAWGAIWAIQFLWGVRNVDLTDYSRVMRLITLMEVLGATFVTVFSLAWLAIVVKDRLAIITWFADYLRRNVVSYNEWHYPGGSFPLARGQRPKFPSDDQNQTYSEATVFVVTPLGGWFNRPFVWSGLRPFASRVSAALVGTESMRLKDEDKNSLFLPIESAVQLLNADYPIRTVVAYLPSLSGMVQDQMAMRYQVKRDSIEEKKDLEKSHSDQIINLHLEMINDWLGTKHFTKSPKAQATREKYTQRLLALLPPDDPRRHQILPAHAVGKSRPATNK